MSRDSIEKKDAIPRIEALLIRGMTNIPDLARSFNVSQNTMRKWINEIEEDWRESARINSDSRRELRIKQLENIAFLAVDSFHRSRKDSESYSIKTEPCPECGGMSTDDEGGHCMECNGSGTKKTETLSVKGSAGDATFLKTAKDVIVEISRIEGSYPIKSAATLREIEQVGNQVDGPVGTRIRELTFEGDDETIIKAMSAMSSLKNSLKSGDVVVVDEGGDDGET